jgi:hypothetical protein
MVKKKYFISIQTNKKNNKSTKQQTTSEKGMEKYPKASRNNANINGGCEDTHSFQNETHLQT